MSIKSHIRYFKSLIREKSKDLTRSGHWPSVRKHHLESCPRCAACGSDKRLQVHHIKPFHLHPELELNDKNLITLCMGSNECHLLIGHGDDYKCYNPNVESDAQACLADPMKRQALAERAKQNRLTADP